MKWVNDNSGRFKQRPLYARHELDVECERALNEFFQSKGRVLEFPISTEDLTIFIEERTEDFDSCTDLSHEGADVEGVTYFGYGAMPRVCISEALSPEVYHNRLRTTLTHELFHVLFHDFLYQSDQPDLFGTHKETTAKCKRDGILGASQNDWMEWQAGYGCGALLIPISALAAEIRNFCRSSGISNQRVLAASPQGQQLIGLISNRFSTSRDAARVRLLQKSILE